MRNVAIREAIAKLTSNPGDDTRISFYRQLGQGLLLVVVSSLPAGVRMGDTLLDADTPVSVLTTSLPNGGDAVVAFTDIESLEARAPGAKHIALGSLDLLRLVIDGGYDALIVNPAGTMGWRSARGRATNSRRRVASDGHITRSLDESRDSVFLKKLL